MIRHKNCYIDEELNILFDVYMMKKFIYSFTVLFLLSCFCSIFANGNQEVVWPDSLDTAKDIPYLTDTEKAVIREMNMVRTNPKLYADYLREEIKLYEGEVRVGENERIRTQEGIPAIKECIRYLEKAKPVGILQSDKDLYQAAKAHAKDQSKTGKVGHNGSDKSNPLTRIKRYYKGDYSSVAENIAYGQATGRNIVMQLLIDDGVPNRGHREAIMKPDFDACGVSINTHPTYRSICVITYIAY